MPDDWFRDPEAERTRVMAAVPENPVFTLRLRRRRQLWHIRRYLRVTPHGIAKY